MMKCTEFIPKIWMGMRTGQVRVVQFGNALHILLVSLKSITITFVGKSDGDGD